MKRCAILLFMLLSFVTFGQKKKKTTALKVNQNRIEQRIFELAKHGMNANGETQRVAFTQSDIDGRNYFMGLMKQAGLDVHIDYAGNIIGRRAGRNAVSKPIVFGSHIVQCQTEVTMMAATGQ